VLGESVVVGILGGILGVALGVLGARLIAAFSPALTATMESAAQIGPPGAAAEDAVQAVAVNLTAPVSLQLLGIAVGLALAGALIAGAFGGWRASRLRPADALRRVD
jgi:ABC-type antimicrobial peptide transport system permease subunit